MGLSATQVAQVRAALADMMGDVGKPRAPHNNL